MLGFAVVIGTPAWLIWRAVALDPSDGGALEARFDSWRIDRGSLVFSYAVRNHSSKDARLTPLDTAINVVQTGDQAPVGTAMLQLPLDLAAHASRTVEVRLEVPEAFWQPLRLNGNLTSRMVDEFLHEALRELDGFELVNENQGVHIRFPRGW